MTDKEKKQLNNKKFREEHPNYFRLHKKKLSCKKCLGTGTVYVEVRGKLASSYYDVCKCQKK